MELQVIEIRLEAEFHLDLAHLEQKIVQESGLKNLTNHHYQILKKSLDARKKPAIYIFRIELVPKNLALSPHHKIEAGQVLNGKSAVIIGFGPGGMFAALRLLENGIKPIIIERGKAVKERRRDLAAIFKEREINPDSNYCFGEGGAGTFSDGKLYTRSKKRGDIQAVLETFVQHGAQEKIRYEAHPHIGTNKLPAIVERIRQTILDAGGELHFETKFTGLKMEAKRLVAVETNKGSFATKHCILATGHSARDVFELLHHQGIHIEAKPFALGVRIEHPQSLIDQIQYRCPVRGEFLPPASYNIVKQEAGRGVFSFCMCPGGIIAPSMTGPEEMVVNGWSPSKRNGAFANSGLVVQVLPEDWGKFGANNPLAAMEFQAAVERQAFVRGGSNFKAPAQRVEDFIRTRKSNHLPETSYLLGTHSVELGEVLPEFITHRMRLALQYFGKRMKGYSGPEAVLLGVESRTSSPVRIPRDRSTMQHPDVRGFYPCGEGAGYAGGIMSAALDGIACADAVASF
ncbi:MAG: putative FAD-dependent dehydrogenase [Bacteroidia bacterium]